jgi:hypothetical protein
MYSKSYNAFGDLGYMNIKNICKKKQITDAWCLKSLPVYDIWKDCMKTSSKSGSL